MLKSLYISYDGLTDPLGRSQVIPYLEGLSKNGCQIQIISFEKKSAYIKNKTIVEEILKKNEIIWHPIPYTSKPAVLSTIYDIFRMISKSVELQKKHNFDIVHARSYISALAALRLKKRFKLSFVFDMRGFWADERVDGKIWNIKNPIFNLIYKYFKKKEKQFFNKADYIISLTNKAIPEIKKIADNNNLKIEVIPCCVDLTHFDYNKFENEFLQKTKIKHNLNQNEFIISYLGSIGTWYLLDEMLEFFVELKKIKQSSKFLFITKENPLNIYEKSKSKKISEDDIIIIQGERDEIPELLTMSDFNIFFIKDCYSKQASSPTKLGEVLGMGIPVITNSGIGDIDYQAKNSEFILLTKEIINEEFKTLINHHIQSETFFSKKIIREKAIEFFDISQGISKYYEVYQHLKSSTNKDKK